MIIETSNHAATYASESFAQKYELAQLIAATLAADDSSFVLSLMRWDSAELLAIANVISSQTAGEIINDLRAYVLPNTKLPLSVERLPFARLTNANIKRALIMALADPAKRGRLSSVVHDRFGISRRCADRYRVFEAHIDITQMDDDLLNELVYLGFEPDGAYINAPVCYKAGLTLAFNPDLGDRGRFSDLRRRILLQSRAAARIIQRKSDVTGFIEVETYGTLLIRKYVPFRPISKIGLERFPVDSSAYKVLYLPNTEVEAESAGIPLGSHKVIDIHIKLPTAVRRREYPEAESSAMLGLRAKLLYMGLHEHITDAGNAIYTGQFLKTVEAKVLFKTLDKYASEFGGFLEMCVEPCIMFWRKSEITGDSQRQLALVSRVLLPN